MLSSSATAGLRPLLRRRLAAAGAARTAAAGGGAGAAVLPSAALLLARRRLSTTTTTSSSSGAGGGLPPPPSAVAGATSPHEQQRRGVMPARPPQQPQPQQAPSKREQRRRQQAEAAAATAALNAALAAHLGAGDSQGALRALMKAGSAVDGEGVLPPAPPVLRPDPRLVHALLLRLCGGGQGEAGPGRAAGALLFLHGGVGGGRDNNKKGARAGGQQQQQRRRRAGVKVGRPPSPSAATGAGAASTTDDALAVVSFSLVLEHCLRHGLVGRALALFEAAERRGVPLDVPACDQLLACLPSLPPPAATATGEEGGVVAGRIDRVLEHLWGHGLAPTATTYACAVWAAVRGGDYLKATQLLQVRARRAVASCGLCVCVWEGGGGGLLQGKKNNASALPSFLPSCPPIGGVARVEQSNKQTNKHEQTNTKKSPLTRANPPTTTATTTTPGDRRGASALAHGTLAGRLRRDAAGPGFLPLLPLLLLVGGGGGGGGW